jgi:hypothetical protein
MTVTLAWLLQCVAFLAFVAATFGVAARVNLLAAGLAVWMLSLLLL